MKKKILSLFLALFLCASTAFAEHFVLVPDTTFVAPFAAEGPVTQEWNNTGFPFSKGIFIITYTALAPDRATQAASYKIYAILEAKDDNGRWYPITMDTLGINSSVSWPIRTFIVSDKIQEKMELPLGADNKHLTRIIYVHGYVPETFRVRFYIKHGSVVTDLTSFTVSVVGRLFN